MGRHRYWKFESNVSSLGKDYFEAQSSWFDLLANNIGCLDIQFNPVLKKEKKHHHEESRIVGNTSHYNADTPSERINGMDQQISSICPILSNLLRNIKLSHKEWVC